jgi:hypothetical protein
MDQFFIYLIRRYAALARRFRILFVVELARIEELVINGVTFAFASAQNLTHFVPEQFPVEPLWHNKMLVA